MRTVLKGKTFVLLASAFEDAGMAALEKPFAMTAEYTGMKFASLLVPYAGVSGDIVNKPDLRADAVDFGKKIALAAARPA